MTENEIRRQCLLIWAGMSAGFMAISAAAVWLIFRF